MLSYKKLFIFCGAAMVLLIVRFSVSAATDNNASCGYVGHDGYVTCTRNFVFSAQCVISGDGGSYVFMVKSDGGKFYHDCNTDHELRSCADNTICYAKEYPTATLCQQKVDLSKNACNSVFEVYEKPYQANTNTATTTIIETKDIRIYGQIKDWQNRPLKNVKVSFWWNADGSADYKKYKQLKDGAADNNGNYELYIIKPADAKNKGKGYIRIDLADSDKKFLVTDFERDVKTSDYYDYGASLNFKTSWKPEVTWYVFGDKGLNSLTRLSGKQIKIDVNFKDDKKNSTNTWEKHATQNASIYVNTMMAEDFYANKLGVNLNGKLLPVVTYYKYNTNRTQYVSPINIEISRLASIAAASYRFELRMNAEWHEFTHAIQRMLKIVPDDYGKNCQGTDNNHYGFRNSCSNDSYIEGMAEFMGQVIYNETFKEKDAPRDAQYYGTEYKGKFDANRYFKMSDIIKINGSRVFESAPYNYSEEKAVAGILWDLYEGKKNEKIKIPITAIWKLLSTKKEFIKYYSAGGYLLLLFKPAKMEEIKLQSANLEDFLNKLKAASVDIKSVSRYPQFISDLYYLLYFNYPANRAEIDKMFINRNIFADRSTNPLVPSNNKYDIGEAIGVPGPNGLSTRQ